MSMASIIGLSANTKPVVSALAGASAQRSAEIIQCIQSRIMEVF
jgi:hypothetical protein